MSALSLILEDSEDGAKVRRRPDSQNGDKCEDGWTLSVDGGTAQACRGQTAAVTGLLPGIHSIKIFGRIGGKEVTAEKSVNVAAGATPEVQVVLAPAGN